MAEERTSRLFMTAGILAVVCSLVVALTAIGLGPLQDENREADRRKNILEVTGLYDPNVPIDEAFARFETKLVDLNTGEYVPEDQIPEGYDQRLATSSTTLSDAVPADEDVAGISRREKYAWVYLVKDGDRLSQVVLPIRGRGLFSTLYGYIALDADLTTVHGLTFYQHGETAGLGAEVENPTWKAKWPGKHVFDEDGDVRLSVIKGHVDPQSADAEYRVDGLSGATMTSRGVTNLVHYWFGDGGFGPYLDRLAQEGGSDGRA